MNNHINKSKKDHGRIHLTGALNSKIGKVHKFLVHAEHVESRKGHDYSTMPMKIGERPKEVINHEFTIRKVAKHKALKNKMV